MFQSRVGQVGQRTYAAAATVTPKQTCSMSTQTYMTWPKNSRSLKIRIQHYHTIILLILLITKKHIDSNNLRYRSDASTNTTSDTSTNTETNSRPKEKRKTSKEKAKQDSDRVREGSDDPVMSEEGSVPETDPPARGARGSSLIGSHHLSL